MARTAKPAPPPKGARGEVLVDAVIASVLAGNEAIEIPVPEPVPPEVLAGLRFSDGSPLPPSLARWLAFDGGWIARELDWFEDPRAPVLEARTVEELVRDDAGNELWAPFYRELPPPLPKGLGLPMEIGGDSMRFYFLAGADDAGEYPVMWLDTDDNPCLGVEAPGFDVWLAERAGIVKGSAYSDAMKKARARLLGKQESVDCNPASEESVAPPPRVHRERKPRVEPPFVLPPGVKGARLTKALVQAIAARNARDVRGYLDAAKAEAPAKQEWKDAALRAAVDNGAAEEAWVRELLALGANPDPETRSPLLYATATYPESLGALRALLEAGANPNRHANFGHDFGPALHVAADYGNVEGVKALLAGGANADETDGDRTALFKVCHRRSFPVERAVAIAEALIDAGATVDWPSNDNGGTPLLWAAVAGSTDVARVLLARGANPNVTGSAKTGNASALALTWRDKHHALFDLLRAHGARLDGATGGPYAITDVSADDGRTPKTMDVRLELSDEPQRVTLRVASLRSRTNQEGLVFGLRSRWLLEWAASGMAGSDVFPPASGVGRTAELPPKLRDATDSPLFEAERAFEIAGVAPSVLARWIHAITETLGPIAELSLVGERAMSAVGGALTVDAARLNRWLRGELEGPPSPHAAPLPFAVADRGKKGRVLAVWFETMPGKDLLDAFDAALVAHIKLFQQGVSVMSAEVAGNVVVWKRTVMGGSPETVNVAAVRAATLNGLVKLGGVTRVEWALGVSGDDGTSVPKGVRLLAWSPAG